MTSVFYHYWPMRKLNSSVHIVISRYEKKGQANYVKNHFFLYDLKIVLYQTIKMQN